MNCFEIQQTPECSQQYDITKSYAYKMLNQEFDGGIFPSEIRQVAKLLASNLKIHIAQNDLQSISNTMAR